MITHKTFISKCLEQPCRGWITCVGIRPFSIKHVRDGGVAIHFEEGVIIFNSRLWREISL